MIIAADNIFLITQYRIAFFSYWFLNNGFSSEKKNILLTQIFLSLAVL